MKHLLGTVVVENIGGAGGSLGAAAVARAQPDGYTIPTAQSTAATIDGNSRSTPSPVVLTILPP